MHVSLYPNPVSDVLNIRGNTTELAIVIYDILGKQIMQSSIMNSLDISLLNNGIYLMELMNLEELAADEAYESFLVVAPLIIKGAMGSPVNPIAIA